MKKMAIMVLITIFGLILITGNIWAQPVGPGYCGGGYYCPWMGGGPGPQGGRGGWYCPWMGPQTGPPVAKPGQALTPDQAKAMVKQHISGNPNLKVAKVTEKDGDYEIDIVTKDGSLVDKIQVNKQTGWFRSAY